MNFTMDDRVGVDGALIDRVRAYWLENGITSRPGVSARELDAFEARNSIRLPTDLRDYFAKMDGMEEGAFDPNNFTFLPLHTVRALTEEPELERAVDEPHRWFVIVDYLIGSALYAIRLTARDEATPVAAIGSSEYQRIVAPSFSAFLADYLADPFSLL